MSWIKKILFLAVGILAPVIFVVVALELIFGSWLYEDKWSEASKINIVRNVKISHNIVYKHGDEPTKITYTKDRYGLRGSCVNPNEISILTVGGSTTAQIFIPDGNTYQDVLQNSLSSKFGRVICVSNAGVEGHSTYGHVESFRVWFPLIEGLKPKYFLFYVGINDAGFIVPPGATSGEFYNPLINSELPLKRLLRQKSVFYNSLRNLRSLVRGITGKQIYATHDPKQFSNADYRAIKHTNSVEVQIAKNTENFEKRFKQLLLQASLYGSKPICVSQPHLYTRTINGTKKGVENVFEYNGTWYNGLDYDTSISELSKSMKRLCLEGNGYFFDMASKKFETGDFYDGVHMTLTGTQRLGSYMYKESIVQKLRF